MVTPKSALVPTSSWLADVVAISPAEYYLGYEDRDLHQRDPARQCGRSRSLPFAVSVIVRMDPAQCSCLHIPGFPLRERYIVSVWSCQQLELFLGLCHQSYSFQRDKWCYPPIESLGQRSCCRSAWTSGWSNFCSSPIRSRCCFCRTSRSYFCGCSGTSLGCHRLLSSSVASRTVLGSVWGVSKLSAEAWPWPITEEQDSRWETECRKVIQMFLIWTFI